jgi:acetyl esterase/lipase
MTATRNRRDRLARAGLLAALAVAASVLSLPPASAGVQVIEGVVYLSTPSVDVKLDVYIPPGEGPFPSLVVVHGGSWTNGSRTEFADTSTELADAGFVVYTVDYRMACDPKNLKPPTIDPALCGYTFPVEHEDIGDAVAWVRQNGGTYNSRTNKVGILGSSAGGNLAMMVGVTGTGGGTRADVIVSWSGAGDLSIKSRDNAKKKRYIGCSYNACPDKWRAASPVYQVDPVDAPLYLSGGGRDDQDPLTDQERTIANWRMAGIPQEWHLEVHSECHARECVRRFPEIFDESVAWLRRWLL